MRILEDVYLVGSGQMGISHPFDCHVYLIDGGDELALVDSGAGVEVRPILSNVRADGLERGKIRKVLLTHHHGYVRTLQDTVDSAKRERVDHKLEIGAFFGALSICLTQLRFSVRTLDMPE